MLSFLYIGNRESIGMMRSNTLSTAEDLSEAFLRGLFEVWIGRAADRRSMCCIYRTSQLPLNNRLLTAPAFSELSIGVSDAFFDPMYAVFREQVCTAFNEFPCSQAWMHMSPCVTRSMTFRAVRSYPFRDMPNMFYTVLVARNEQDDRMHPDSRHELKMNFVSADCPDRSFTKSYKL